MSPSKAQSRVTADLIAQALDRAIVGLVHDEPGRAPTDWGSGTLYLARSGRVVCLTAGHTLQRMKGRRLIRLLTHRHDYDDAIEKYTEGPPHERTGKPMDVGLAILRPEVSEEVSEEALPLLEAPSRQRVQQFIDGPNPLILAGLPRQLSRRDGDSAYLPTLIMNVRDARLGDGTISLGFKRGITRNELWHPQERIWPAETWVNLKKPDGISGGPIFGIQARPISQLWTIETCLRLIAVTHEYTNGRQQGILSYRFIDWLGSWLDRL